MADANNYPNSGTLFVRQKKGPKAPDYGGDFTLDGDVLDYIIRKAERGEPVKLDISGWKRMGRNNTTFVSINIQTPYSERSGNDGQRATPSGRTGYQNQSRGYQREPIQTSRGQYQRQGDMIDDPRQAQGRGGYDDHRQQGRGGYVDRGRNQNFHDELNDDLPPF